MDEATVQAVLAGWVNLVANQFILQDSLTDLMTAADQVMSESHDRLKHKITRIEYNVGKWTWESGIHSLFNFVTASHLDFAGVLIKVDKMKSNAASVAASSGCFEGHGGQGLRAHQGGNGSVACSSPGSDSLAK
jgi:hypothetical protein